MAERTTFHVHPERSAPREISTILAAGIVAHVGLVDTRGPDPLARGAAGVLAFPRLELPLRR